MNHLTRVQREELNLLCKEVFGVSSRWQKLHAGIPEVITKTIKETVPGDKGAPDTVQEKVVPVLDENGARTLKFRQYSFEELHKMLLDAKKQRDNHIANMKASEDFKKIEQQVHEQASGKLSVS